MLKILNRIKTNWKSALTVSLISIPLSVSLAVASQSTPLVGIITAIWAGLFASIFGGSNFNVVGPTGALSGIIAAFVLTHGASSVSMLAIVSGVIILFAYLLKLEKYLVFIPSSVIHGFTLGVAFVIGLGQLNYALGLSGLPKHTKFIENLFESFKHVGQLSWVAVGIFLLFLAGLFIFKKLLPRLPGAIILSPIGIFLGYLVSVGKVPFQLDTLGHIFGTITPHLFLTPHFFFDMPLLSASFTIALVAILETMLSAKIADGMTKTKHNERKEMLGLSLANIASGLAGGLPATAALARTSLNVKTGADHSASATMNSLAVALISILFLRYFTYIPMAVIAAILVYTAIQMVEAEHYLRFFRSDKPGFIISLLVAFVTVYEDPIVGILLGTGLALILFVEKLSHGQFETLMNTRKNNRADLESGEKIKEIAENPEILLYSIKGSLVYVNTRAHINRFETSLKSYKTIIIRLREVYFMDLDGVEALDEIISLVTGRGQRVLLTGVNQWISQLLTENSHQYQKLQASGAVFDKATDALRTLNITERLKSAVI